MCPVFLSWPHHSPPSTTHKFPPFSLSSHSFFSLSPSPLPPPRSSLLSSYHTSFFHLQLQLPSSSSSSTVDSESDTRISARMRNLSSVKRELLRKWIKDLRKWRSLKNNMSFLERKKAIKLSADLAMASTRSGTTRWSRALIAEATSRDDDDNGYNKILTEHIVGSPENHQRPTGNTLIRATSSSSSSGLCTSRRILKRSRMLPRRVVKKKKTKKIGSRKVMANCIAKKLGKKKTRMLKSLLPGGESMEDDVVLIEETLDYIQSLRAQVEVMRCLATASELIRNS